MVLRRRCHREPLGDVARPVRHVQIVVAGPERAWLSSGPTQLQRIPNSFLPTARSGASSQQGRRRRPRGSAKRSSRPAHSGQVGMGWDRRSLRHDRDGRAPLGRARLGVEHHLPGASPCLTLMGILVRVRGFPIFIPALRTIASAWSGSALAVPCTYALRIVILPCACRSATSRSWAIPLTPF